MKAAQALFLTRGFGDVSMDDLAQTAGVARRTLYNQFGSKEEILRAMLLEVADGLRTALPPGIETAGDAAIVLRLIAKGLLTLQDTHEFIGIIRMAIADTRQFPWIADEFHSVLKPYEERFARYLAHLTSLGLLDCQYPLLAAHQFLGLLNGPILWPRILGQESVDVPVDTVIDETVTIFLQRYRSAEAAQAGQTGSGRRRS